MLQSGLITSEQLSTFCHALARSGEEIWRLSAFSNLVPLDDLLAQARVSDERRKSGKSLSMLDGIPVSVKSNLAVASQPLHAGSRVLQQEQCCGYDADATNVLLRDCGSILIGMTSMDEFGMGSLGTNVVSNIGSDVFTTNPTPYLSRLRFSSSSNSNDDLLVAETIKKSTDEIMELHLKAIEEDEERFSAGGSSCGSAVSIAHGSSLLSLGTDTGGSIRLPAAWCGVCGLKPSYGLLSRHGVISYASSFDTVGILGRSSDCLAIALDKLAQCDGFGRRDSTSSYDDFPQSLCSIDYSNDLSDIIVGIPSALSIKECPPKIKEAWSRAAQLLSKKGASVQILDEEDLDPALFRQSLAAYYVLVSAEASSNLSRYDGFRYGVASDNDSLPEAVAHAELTPLEFQYSQTRVQSFGKDVARRILCGVSVLSSDRFHSHYESAAKLRAALSSQLHQILKDKVDIILFPTAVSLPWSLDRRQVDTTEMFSNDILTVVANLAGLPAMSIPVSIAQDHYFKAGLQVVGPRLQEDVLLRVGNALEHNATT